MHYDDLVRLYGLCGVFWCGDPAWLVCLDLVLVRSVGGMAEEDGGGVKSAFAIIRYPYASE